MEDAESGNAVPLRRCPRAVRHAEERAAYLDTACGDDDELQQRIDALLYAHNKAGGVPPA